MVKFSDIRDVNRYVSEQFENADHTQYVEGVENMVADDLMEYLSNMGLTYGDEINSNLIPCVFQVAEQYEKGEQ